MHFKSSVITYGKWPSRTQNFNQPSKHPRYMVKCTQLGANPSVPNWVRNLCSKLGFLRQIPHSRILLIYVPNWVHNSYTQLGAKNMYPIGCKESVPNWVHKMCTQLGAKNRYPIGYTNIYLMCYLNYMFWSIFSVTKATSSNFLHMFVCQPSHWLE